jgi:hypothetical protein
MYSALHDAAELRDVLIVSLPVEPAFNAYHDDASFQSFLETQRLASLEEWAGDAPRSSPR